MKAVKGYENYTVNACVCCSIKFSRSTLCYHNFTSTIVYRYAIYQNIVNRFKIMVTLFYNPKLSHIKTMKYNSLLSETHAIKSEVLITMKIAIL
jgi:hypothetical protein